MTIQPLGDRVLIKISKSETQTKSGLLIPDAAQEKTQQGEIIAKGDSEEITVKAGDVVLYDKYAGTNIKIENEEHLILRNDDIIAVVK